ncbi:MAG: hypothetical protein ABH851_07355 [Methanobacteriota archaeon]
MDSNLKAVLLALLAVVAGAGGFSDDFSGTVIDNDSWTVVSGDWIQNETLSSYWDLADACSIQGRIHLADSLQPTGDYSMSIDFYDAHGRFSVGFLDAQHAYNIVVDGSGPYRAMIERKNGSGCYVVLLENHSVLMNGSGLNILTVNKTGVRYDVLVNGGHVLFHDDTAWNGTGKVGLNVYGPVEFDNFRLEATRSKNITLIEGWNLISVPIVI